ncbi:MAG: iron-siderophore ABC transporter substrate-binding protein [Leptolyngbyaceae cyanobacterium]
MKRFFRNFTSLLITGILLFLLISACGRVIERQPTEPQDIEAKPEITNCRVVQHTMGEICIPHNLERVVTLRPDHFFNCLALDIRPIAFPFIDGILLPEEIQADIEGVESVGNLDSPNVEKILQLQPDLIISNSRLDAIYDQLSQIAPTVVFDVPKPPLLWKEELAQLAQALNKEAESQQLMDNYWQRIEELKQALGARRNDIEVSFAGTASGTGIWAYGKQHPVSDILHDIGLQRPPTQRDDVYYVDNISAETLTDIDGDVIFFTSWARTVDRDALEMITQKPLWQKLKAVQQQQAYIVDTYWHNAGNIVAINLVLDDLFKYLANG